MAVGNREESVVCSRPELVGLFPFYANGRISVIEKEAIDEHLEQCASCREELKFFSELRRVGRRLFVEE